MKKNLNGCRTISVDTQMVIEKNFFDENYAFRHIPALFQNAFKHWFATANGELVSVQKPSYLECWYEQYAVDNSPEMPSTKVDATNSISEFSKNIWDLSSWHYLSEGEITWLIFPPTVIEYLQLSTILPEASAEEGLNINIEEIALRYNIKPLKITQTKGGLLFIPPMYAYSQERSQHANLFSKTILTEYNHDNLYAYFRKTEYKPQIKQIILNGFSNTKHLSVYETPTQRLSNQAAA